LLFHGASLIYPQMTGGKGDGDAVITALRQEQNFILKGN
jgi:hypothetical protein